MHCRGCCAYYSIVIDVIVLWWLMDGFVVGCVLLCFSDDRCFLTCSLPMLFVFGCWEKTRRRRGKGDGDHGSESTTIVVEEKQRTVKRMPEFYLGPTSTPTM